MTPSEVNAPVSALAAPVTLDISAPLTDPEWLVGHRIDAEQRLAVMQAPTTRLEEWRYSRLRQLSVLGQPTVDRPVVDDDRFARLLADLIDDDEHCGSALVVDGHVVESRLDPELVERGVRLGGVGSFDIAPGTAWAIPGVDAFAELNAWASPDPLVLHVPAHVVIEHPILIRHHASGAPGVGLPRLVVVAGENSQFEVVDWWSGDSGAASVVARVDVDVAPAARVRIATVQTLDRDTDLVASMVGRVERDASLRLTHVALGGRYARTRFDCGLTGRGSSGDIAAVYLGHGNQMHDLRTFQDHEAPDTHSNLAFKGALDDQAHAVYTGLIRVGEAARGTNAEQSNRIIKLSDDAWAESVPNLEIHNNDVRCAHASTVGPIDEDQRFYLESRGVPPDAAERLVVAGFFEDVLAALPTRAFADRLRHQISERLAAT